MTSKFELFGLFMYFVIIRNESRQNSGPIPDAANYRVAQKVSYCILHIFAKY